MRGIIFVGGGGVSRYFITLDITFKLTIIESFLMWFRSGLYRLKE